MTDIPDFDEITLAKLAREMAMNIRPVKQIFADFNIDEESYYELSKIEFFKKALETFVLEWNATTSTADRLKFQNQAGLEQLMPILIRRAMRESEPLASANETAKITARLGGIGEAKSDGSKPSDRFVISINLGADVDGKPIIETYDKSVAIDANDMDITPARKTKVDDLTPAQLEMFATQLGGK